MPKHTKTKRYFFYFILITSMTCGIVQAGQWGQELMPSLEQGIGSLVVGVSLATVEVMPCIANAIHQFICPAELETGVALERCKASTLFRWDGQGQPCDNLEGVPVLFVGVSVVALASCVGANCTQLLWKKIWTLAQRRNQ